MEEKEAPQPKPKKRDKPKKPSKQGPQYEGDDGSDTEPPPIDQHGDD